MKVKVTVIKEKENIGKDSIEKIVCRIYLSEDSDANWCIQERRRRGKCQQRYVVKVVANENLKLDEWIKLIVQTWKIRKISAPNKAFV